MLKCYASGESAYYQLAWKEPRQYAEECLSRRQLPRAAARRPGRRAGTGAPPRALRLRARFCPARSKDGTRGLCAPRLRPGACAGMRAGRAMWRGPAPSAARLLCGVARLPPAAARVGCGKRHGRRGGRPRAQ